LGQAEGEHGIGFETEKSGVGMIINGTTGPVGEVGGVPDMVPMAVGEEEGVGFDFFLFQKIEKTFGGIDGEAMTVEVDEVGVGGGEAARVGQGFRHCSSFIKRFVCIYDYVCETVRGAPWAERPGWRGEEKAL